MFCSYFLFLFFLLLPAIYQQWWRRKRKRERESNITFFFFLGLEIDIKYNKWGIINEILIKILALMRVFFFYRWIYLNPKWFKKCVINPGVIWIHLSLSLSLSLYVSLSISFSSTIVERLPTEEGKKNIKKIIAEHYIRCLWEGKQKWKQRERDKEGKQVNANRKQELALINRKVSTYSDKCATFHDFSLDRKSVV